MATMTRTRPILRMAVPATLAVAIAAGCGGVPDDDSADTTTSAPADTTTSSVVDATTTSVPGDTTSSTAMPTTSTTTIDPVELAAPEDLAQAEVVETARALVAQAATLAETVAAGGASEADTQRYLDTSDALDRYLAAVEDEAARLELTSQVPLVAQTPLTPYGVGPLRAGMTLAEAEAASGLDIEDGNFVDFGGFCYFGSVDSQPDLLMILVSPDLDPENPTPVETPEEGIIGRVGLRGVGGEPTARTTPAGIGLGSTEAEVYETYGDDVRTEDHVYLEDGHYLFEEPAHAPDNGLAFFTDGETVENVYGGLRDIIGYVEGCA
ncbi:MAG: hypothetical protein S0880_00345 [Actinomycetota bacterium]|nr:hypothetical protein [Actinomycetota bacterium]